MEKQKTVFVGLSGGVDSSVAALRLMQQGYDVVGVFIKVWHPDFLVCDWEKERLDAMRVAAKLDIPFLTCDAQQAYKDDVAENFIAEYKAGRTPNPDVLCNKYVKFGAFLDFARKHGADYVATGHYAQKKQSGGTYQLHRGVDINKDQSYFLWTLTQEQLAQTLFPVGDTPKEQIREEAKKAGLLTAQKKDSQGICFLGHIDIPEFLSHYTTLTEGVVLDTAGKAIGTHVGALVYTKGQRHGFVVNTTHTERTPMYVVSRDIEKNTITVSSERLKEEQGSTVTLTNSNAIADPFKEGMGVSFQSRYRQAPSTGVVEAVREEELTLQLSSASEGMSVGQSCVLYAGTQCLGGGIIA